MRAVALLLAGLVLVHGTSPLAAPARPSSEIQRIIDDGTRLFKEGRFEDALGQFRVALERTKDARLLYLVGRSLESLDRPVEALAAYEQFLAGDVPADARARAESSVRQLRERLAKGRLLFQIAPFGAVVRLDGEPLGSAPLPPWEGAPGPHELVVSAPGHGESRVHVEVPAGGEASVAIELAPLPADVPPVAPPLVTDRGEPLSYAPWTWVALGVGVTLAAGGTLLFALGELDHQEIADGLSDEATPALLTYREARDLDEAGDAKKLAGYALWGVGGAALVGATVLFVLEATAPEPGGGPTVGVAPVTGGGFVTLEGRF